MKRRVRLQLGSVASHADDPPCAQPEPTYCTLILQPYRDLHTSNHYIRDRLRSVVFPLPIASFIMSPLEEMHTAMVNRSIRTIKAVCLARPIASVTS